MKIALTVNGRLVEADVAPRTNLADLVREQLLLTGTHVGCEHGICGACTVEIDGEIARSCITYAVACDGANVRTIEAFDDDPLDGPPAPRLQRGACAAVRLLHAGHADRRARSRAPQAGPVARGIRAEMSGNLCRCTGYMGIVNAISRVMAETPAAQQPPARPANDWLGPAPGPAAVAATARETPWPPRDRDRHRRGHCRRHCTGARR